MQKSGEVLKIIITIIVCMVAIGAISFAAYVYISPENVEIVDRAYNNSDMAYYNVDENELNGQWLSMHVYSVDKNILNKYEDLKEFYKGRDNPFGTMGEYREQIIVEQEPIIPEEEEKVIE